jgi:hypothetical protein
MATLTVPPSTGHVRIVLTTAAHPERSMIVGRFASLGGASRMACDLAQSGAVQRARVENLNRGTWKAVWTWAAVAGLLVVALIAPAQAAGPACHVTEDGHCLLPSEEGRAYDERADAEAVLRDYRDPGLNGALSPGVLPSARRWTPYRIPDGVLDGSSGGSSVPFDLEHARPFFFVLVQVDGSALLGGPFEDAASCKEHVRIAQEDFEGRVLVAAVSECFVLGASR